ncbi:beta strand repeat-containing protein, partial [Flavobacterium cheniae]|uniref:beta strand repeat-containing protein n=1 Tax=Flavobacterium cheniae TaxID=295428 RepID=UPI003743BABC
NTIASGTSQTVCINSAITNITLATTGATGATFAGLPAGVTGSWAGNVATISGTPTASGIFNYTVTTTGGCPPATTTGTITVTPLNTIASGTSQTVCINTAITNITLATTGATGATFAGLPAGVTGSWAGNVATISGTPTASGIFNYTVTTTGGCPPATTTGTITVTPLNTIASGTSQTVCINSAITNITLATTGATGATFAGLPAGVTGSWAGNVATISGTPTASGIFNYTVTTTGGCPPATTTGTITVTPLNTIASGTSQTVCINSAITNITLATTGATGATFAGLPAGVTGSWAGNVATISGTPTASGIFNYTVTTTGGCPPATTTGTITVTPLNTIASGTSQTVCINSAITNITLATTGATGATFAGLPAGVTGSWAGNVATISGTPTASGIFNYTVTTTGGCPPATTTGTITVTPLNTIASGTSQTVCVNSAITNITLATTGATGATFAGLPAGVTGSWAGNVATISGTPTASGIFNYTVTTTGGCPPATTTGTINVNPTAVPVTGFSYSTPVCINGTNPIPTTVPGFTTGGNYSSPGLSINTSTGEINLALSTAGTYTVTYFYGATACGAAGSSTFDITITPLPLISLTSVATTTNQTLCINTPVTNITYAVTNATGAIVSGLPVGVTGSFAAGVFTISGTPTASGIFNYTVTTTGGCSPAATTTGTITVTPQNTIASGTSQTVCINTAITNITLATTGATGATFAGLPAGVTGSWAGNVATISGTPTASGIFNYTVTTTGGCPPATTTGTITVTPLNTIASGTSQTVCINSAITNITLATTGATGATFAGLPAGVTGSWAGNVATISGTPTASGIFNYTVTTTGGCPPATTTGTITVTPLNTIASGTSQTVCINTAITNITLATTGATGATFAGLPAGVTGSWAGNVATISGTPTASGIFNYTVTTTGGCPPATTTGTITVTPL